LEQRRNVRKSLKIRELRRVAIVGVGLLGGSIGLALRAAGFGGVRVGVGRRESSLRKALACDTVDEVTCDPAAGVAGAELVILCTPIGRFEALLRQIVPALAEGAFVTDVASTKAEVVRLAERLLPRSVRFVGSHPMAGSEKTGVEFARADLFQDALCLLTPTARTAPVAVREVGHFWEALGARTLKLTPARHDRFLARASHLPHATAAALVRLAQAQGAIDVAGPGFADATRIASGDPAMWTDIFRTNRKAMVQAVDRLIAELAGLRARLEKDDARGLEKWLTDSKEARDQWVARRYRKPRGREA